jgi:hypothetical protein
MHTYIHAESAVSGKMHVNARGSAVSELPGGRRTEDGEEARALQRPLCCNCQSS